MANEEKYQWEPELADLLDAEKAAPAVDPSIKARILERVQHSVAAPPVGAEVAGTASASAATATTIPWFLVGTGLLAIAGLAYWATPSEPVSAPADPAVSAKAEAPQAVNVSTVVPEKRAIPKEAKPAEPEPAAKVSKGEVKATPVATQVVKEAVPQTTPATVTSSKTVSNKPDVTSSVQPPSKPVVVQPVRRRVRRDMKLERALVERARSALKIGDPTRAHRLLKRHERRYPKGFLAEERSSLMVRVLMKLGKKDAAQRKAKRFLKRYPKSLQRTRVEGAVKAKSP